MSHRSLPFALVLLLSACGASGAKSARHGAKPGGPAGQDASAPSTGQSEGEAVPKELDSATVDDLRNGAGGGVIVAKKDAFLVPDSWPDDCSAAPHSVRLGMNARTGTLFLVGDDKTNIMEARTQADGVVLASLDGLSHEFTGVKKLVICGFGGNDVIKTNVPGAVIDGGTGDNQISKIP